MKNKHLFWLLLCILPCTKSISQLDKKETALAVIRQLRDTYSAAKGLSADIAYYYANENEPARYMDSLKGNILLNGKEYRLVLDNTIAVVNERYSIMLFGEDHIMYLSKPSQAAGTYNPVAALDSLVSGTKGIALDIQSGDAYKTVTISFPEGMPYKKMSFNIDNRTGYLIKTVMVVKTELMAPSADPAALKKSGYDDYAVVETRFTSYKNEPVAGGLFDENSFFRKEGKEFAVTEKYKDYKIFLGSPNL